MRIGIDAACWSNQRGYGRFTRELLKALLRLDQENEYVFFADRETNEMVNIPAGVSRIELDITETSSKAASADGRCSLMDMWKMGNAVARESLDISFFPSVYTYFPILSRVKKIVVIHDVIAEKYPQLIFNNRKHRFFWNLRFGQRTNRLI